MALYLSSSSRPAIVRIGSGGAAALTFLAATIGARSVVEIGTGTGVSGVWLLRGMRADGVLTTIDVEPEHHRAARTATKIGDIAVLGGQTFAAVDHEQDQVGFLGGAHSYLDSISDRARLWLTPASSRPSIRA